MNSRNLTGRVAIVTGASRGIGKAIALSLAGHGVNIALVARTQKDLAHATREVQSAGAAGFAVPADLANPSAAVRIVQETVAHFGRLDILINNAGVTHAAPIDQTPAEVFDRLMAVNARAPFLLCRHAIQHLRKSEVAAVINICSVVAHKGYPHQSAYAASKHALLGMTKVLAKELHQDGIRVHAVSPGGVATAMSGQVRPDLDDATLMPPQDIAEIVLFLLTNRSNAMIDEIRVRRASAEPFL